MPFFDSASVMVFATLSDKLRNEFLKMIAGMTIEVRAEVKLVPDKVKAHADTPSLLPKVNVTELKARASGKRSRE